MAGQTTSRWPMQGEKRKGNDRGEGSERENGNCARRTKRAGVAGGARLSRNLGGRDSVTTCRIGKRNYSSEKLRGQSSFQGEFRVAEGA